MAAIKGKNTKPEMLVRRFILSIKFDLWPKEDFGRRMN